MSDDCIICGKWPEAAHWALGEMLDTLPLNDEPILRQMAERVLAQHGIAR